MVDQMDDHDPDLARFTNDAGSDGEAEDPFFSHLGELFFCVVDVVAQDDMVCLHFVVEISTLSIFDFIRIYSIHAMFVCIGATSMSQTRRFLLCVSQCMAPRHDL